MSATIPFTKKNNQTIVSTSHDNGLLIAEANENEMLCFILRSDSEAFEQGVIEIYPSEYESPKEAMLADEIHSSDGSSKLTQDELEGFYAYVLGGSIVPIISGFLLDLMFEHDTDPENPCHLTAVQICDNFNFAASGADRIERYDHKRVYEPHDKHVQDVLYEYLGRYSSGFYTYNPAEMELDFKRNDDCAYVVICDYYRDVHDDNRMVQNIVVAELHI
ncbi:hypothetical protein [Arsukibacterium sp.]|uniref:hypothetical protein n=1 Tax=Arsukibacterium sp. TaxID=1977258 RepID=UPI001BD4C492|nr:hypothetical protein [Arsukibacterium sp.]